MKNLLGILAITIFIAACSHDIKSTYVNINKKITHDNDSIISLINNVDSNNGLNIERNNIAKLITQIKTIILKQADSDKAMNTEISKGYETLKESIKSYQIAIINDLVEDTIGFNQSLTLFTPFIDSNTEERPWEFDFNDCPGCAAFLILSKLERDVNFVYLQYQRRKQQQGKTSNIKEQDAISIWVYDCESETPLKNRKIKADTLTPKKLINFINVNKGGDNIRLDFVKVSHDTIFINIKESTYLTQQIGTCGADDFMITTTYTLTELMGVNYVNFDFEEGDHAIPGTYSRKYYEKRHEEFIKLNK